MPRLFLTALVGVALAAGLLPGAVRGDPPAAPPETCAPGGLPPVAPWAQPSNTPAFVGYYVGGGCANGNRGERRYPCEGTWGWDYSGWCLHRRVELLWWHGRRDQGGVGAYREEGPEPLKRLHEACDEGP